LPLLKFQPSYIYIFLARQPPVGKGVLIVEASPSHPDTSKSVGLLWTSGHPDAETSIWQHTTLTRDRLPCPQWDSNSQSQLASCHTAMS